MPLRLNSNRQRPAVVIQDFTFDQLQDALTQAVAQMPGGAIVTSGHLMVTTAFTGATTALVGDSALPNRYTPTALDLKTNGLKPLTATGYKVEQIQNLLLTLDAKPTAGAGRLIVEYVEHGAGHFVQG